MSEPVGTDALAAGAVLCHVVPLLVSRLPEVPGATKVGELVPFPRITLFAVRVVAPVPPLETLRVPVWSLCAKDDTKICAVPAALVNHIFPSAALIDISPAVTAAGTAAAV
jgi:hypothetical protein